MSNTSPMAARIKAASCPISVRSPVDVRHIAMLFLPAYDATVAEDSRLRLLMRSRSVLNNVGDVASIGLCWCSCRRLWR